MRILDFLNKTILAIIAFATVAYGRIPSNDHGYYPILGLKAPSRHLVKDLMGDCTKDLHADLVGEELELNRLLDNIIDHSCSEKEMLENIASHVSGDKIDLSTATAGVNCGDDDQDDLEKKRDDLHRLLHALIKGSCQEEDLVKNMDKAIFNLHDFDACNGTGCGDNDKVLWI